MIDDPGRVPPNDLGAEAAVLSAILFPIDEENRNQVLDEVIPILFPQHLYSDANRTIYQAIVSLRAAGMPVDAVTVRGWLADAGKLERVGGDQYLEDLMLKVPATAYPVAYARRIVAKARVRSTIATLQEHAALGYCVNGESNAYLESVLRSVQDCVKPDDKGFRLLTGDQIFAQLDPIKWVSPELCLGPGRPTLVPGYGYSLKTYSLQSMAVAIATGRRIWGEFRCVKGKVLHLDYEQGEYATRTRYQRLAFGLGASPEELFESLSLACFPDVYLNSPGVEGTLCRLCDTFSLCIIDSFRAAVPGVDENDSGVRLYLDILTRVSERTGCAFVVVHHAGKDSPDRDSRQSARGSSAIFDACGTVLKLAGKKAFEPVKVELVKTSAAASGKMQQTSFYIEAVDICSDDGSNPKAGIRIEHRTEEQIDQPESPAVKISSLKPALTELLQRHPTGLSTREVLAFLRRNGSRCRTEDVMVALRTGSVDGWCREGERSGRGGGKLWCLSSTPIEQEAT
jgi:hypothetical protein